jgi:hypothetical protein
MTREETVLQKKLGAVAKELGLDHLQLAPSTDPLVPVLFFRGHLRAAGRFMKMIYDYLYVLQVRERKAVYDHWHLILSSHARDGFALYDFPGPGRAARDAMTYRELLRLAKGVRQLLRQKIKPVETISAPQEKPQPFSSATQMDKPLRTLVPRLNALGYKTLASCSGHDKPNPSGLETYAYVTFKTTHRRARSLLKLIESAEDAFQGKWVIITYPEAGPGIYSLQRFPECWTKPQEQAAHQDIQALTHLLKAR